MPSKLITLDQLPFFKWRGIRVMTTGMVDRLHNKAHKTTAKILRRAKDEFVMGRDVYVITSKDDLNAIPLGAPGRSLLRL